MPDIPEQSDAEVIKAILSGDKEAFRGILSKYQSRVYSMAYAITQNAEDASEVAQDVFIRFYRNIEQFDSRRPLLPYLLKITVNRSRDILRMRMQSAKYFKATEMENLERISDLSPNPFENIANSERTEKIRELIGKLPLMLREIMTLFYLSERSCIEVAEILSISENSVKVGLYRARRKIIETLSSRVRKYDDVYRGGFGCRGL